MRLLCDGCTRFRLCLSVMLINVLLCHLFTADYCVTQTTHAYCVQCTIVGQSDKHTTVWYTMGPYSTLTSAIPGGGLLYFCVCRAQNQSSTAYAWYYVMRRDRSYIEVLIGVISKQSPLWCIGPVLHPRYSRMNHYFFVCVCVSPVVHRART